MAALHSSLKVTISNLEAVSYWIWCNPLLFTVESVKEDSTSDGEEFSAVVPEEEDSIQKTTYDLPKNIIENKDGPNFVQLDEKSKSLQNYNI